MVGKKLKTFCILLPVSAFFLIASQAISQSKWDRVEALGPGIVTGTVAERLHVKEEIMDILLAHEEGYPIYYVDSRATGTGDGSSWQNAYTSLQAAINRATQTEGWIWVAEGSYTGSSWAIERNQNIEVAAIRVKPRAAVFGGFNGTETHIAQRNPELNRTIIHGRISDKGPRAVQMDHLSLLDGFEIKDSGFQGYGSVWADFTAGGGIRCGDWLSIIRNNRVHGNFGKDGVGITAWNRDNLHNVQDFSPIIERNVIYDNFGVCGAGAQMRDSEALFAHNVVVDNYHDEKPKGVEIVIDPAHSGRPVVVNCILWGNAPLGWFGDLYNHVDRVNAHGDAAKAISEYNCIQKSGYGPGLITDGPHFVDRNARDYRLRDTSPLINRGHPDGPLDPDGTRADIGIFYWDKYGISGKITYMESGTAVPNVDLIWNEETTQVSQTDHNGSYNWEDIPGGTEVTLSCQVPDADNENPVIVSAWDAALIARHCIGLTSLDSYALLAADVDQNGRVDMRDAVWIARTAAGIDNSDYASCLEWRFNPPELYFPAVNASYINQNITAWILGDVSGDWQPSSGAAKSMAGAESDTPDYEVLDGFITIPLYLQAEGGVLSSDIWMAYEGHLLEADEVILSDEMDGFQLIVNRKIDNQLRIAVFGAEPADIESPAVELRFKIRDENARHFHFEWIRYQINDQSQPPGGWMVYTSVDNAESFQPLSFDLKGNYPNPFNPGTIIKYQINEISNVTLNIFDIKGRLIQTLVNTSQTAGSYQMEWDGKDQSGHVMPSGIYICRLQAGQHTASLKLLKAK